MKKLLGAWVQQSVVAAVMVVPVIAQAGPAPDTALSKATLNYHWSNVTCGWTTGGVTTMADCASPSFSAVVAGGGSVFVSATFNYTYHDDGMALDRPVYFQMDPRGMNMLQVDNEAAIIYFNTFGFYPSQFDRVITTNVPNYLLLGNNTTGDDLSGQLNLQWTTTLIPDYYPQPVSMTVSASISPYHTMVASVPEPSTYALMGLGLLALWARRRSAQGSRVPPRDVR